MKYLILILLLLVNICESQTTEKKNNLFVGIIKGDGILVPIAKYDSPTWKNIIDKHNDKDFYFAQSENWWFYDSTSKPIELVVGDIVIYRPGVNYSGSGYITSYILSKKSFSADFYSNAFASTSSALKVSLFTSKNDSYKKILDSVFIFKEDMLLTSLRSNSDYLKIIPVNKKQRESFDMKYSTSYSTIDSTRGVGLMYFVVNRYYPKSDCGMIAQLTGWLINNNGRFSIINEAFRIDDCDGKMLSENLDPIASFKVNNNNYILTAVLGYEGYGFDILEYKDSTIISVLPEQ